jgi:hypothetical protein
VHKVLSIVLCVPILCSAALAENRAGFGADRGLGITAQMDGRINLFIGNNGLAGDYLIGRGSFSSVEGTALKWYFGAGLWADWDSGFGVRAPFGLEFEFAPRWRAYGQIAPDLDLDDGAGFGLSGAVGLRYRF